MKRLVRIALVALPLVTLAAAPAYAEVKTRDKSTVKFEGMLGRMFNLFGGKGAKEGIESKVAVKGSRKATINDATGTIIDLSEEKVYDLDMRKKTYTVTTFDELRRRMREAEEKAEKQAQKEEPQTGQKEEPQKPQKEYEFDFDVKDTGEKKQVAGYDTHETIATLTIHEKGKTLEDAGGMVMTSDMWLGPQIPQMKELADFNLKYAKQLEGPQTEAISAEQMAAVLKMFPLIGKGMARLQKDNDKLSGTPLETTLTFETVKSKEQLDAEQKQSADSGGGGIRGMLAKKMMKKSESKPRATVMTTHTEVLEVSTSVLPADLAVPADFKEKK
jgi:hypothetical protein